MTEINLLPVEFSQSGESVRYAKPLRKVILALAGIFFLIVALGIAAIILLTQETENIIAQQNSLRQTIESLQNTEQKLFIIQDRLEKINLVTTKAVENSFVTIDNTLLNLPANMFVEEIQITATGNSFSVNGGDSLATASFLNSLVASGKYKSLSIKEFTYTPNTGYKISLESVINEE